MTLTRSETMARVKSKHTAPELAVRRALHRAGLRYRLHCDLPGRPDLVFASRRAIVFVHGCFWHSHPGCPRARLPASRQEYWLPKLARNAQRDHLVQHALAAAGWRVHIIWECEIARPGRLAHLAAAISNGTPAPGSTGAPARTQRRAASDEAVRHS